MKKSTIPTPPVKLDMEQGWNPNTELGCEVKTILRSDRKMKVGKEYQGVLRRDTDADVDEFLCRDAHYTFIETVPHHYPPQRRQPVA